MNVSNITAYKISGHSNVQDETYMEIYFEKHGFKYEIEYKAEKSQDFQKFLPVAVEMIKSIEINIPGNIKELWPLYKDSNNRFSLQHPFDWGIIENSNRFEHFDVTFIGKTMDSVVS